MLGTRHRRRLAAVALLALGACGQSGAANTSAPPVTVPATTQPATTRPATTVGSTSVPSVFPVTVEASNGPVALTAKPVSIVSLSSVATEMLFAIDAGSQVVAVDDQSNYPPDAPMTDLSGYTPNIEAIAGYDPDLVIVSNDLGDVVAGLGELGIPVAVLEAAAGMDDVYHQIEILGTMTGHVAEAQALVTSMQARIDQIASSVPRPSEPLTYFHEIDSTLYTATSSTFIGSVYGLLGLVDVADPADDGTAFGYPQVSEEYVISADPDLIFLADAQYGETAATVAARPGWAGLSAVRDGAVVELPADISSRWGPRIVDFLEVVADAVRAHTGGGG